MDGYLQYREQMKTGDILQWKSNTPIGFAIRFFSGAYKKSGAYNANHTSMIVDIETSITTSRKFMLEAVSSGVVLSAVSRVLKKFNGELYLLPLKDEFDNKRSTLKHWAIQEVGVEYDYVGLVSQIFGRISVDVKQYFCSEYVYVAYQNANIPMNNPSGLAPRPNDIPSLGCFKPAIKI